MSLATSLEQIEQWLQQHTPTTAALLAPPATAAEIATLEEVVGFRLRPEVEALLRWHNGSTGFDGAFPLAPVHRMLDTRQIAERWRTINDVTRDSRVEWPDLWRPTWLPLTTDEGLASIMVDHSPGATGEVFYWDHVDTRNQQVPPWPNLASEVADLATALLTGGRMSGSAAHPGLRPVVAYDGELGWDD
ncbi:SMI1/KNR4 family protein [Dactylosporangium sp. NPDC000521]|uniref:SMI1/KNR4 family protein n=1 Tax=Dactylosporangium sp. NPDC000521 TaxID=3363975 RepID=UPI00369BC408